MGAAQQQWLAPQADRLSIVTLNPLTTVYDRASGQTHLLAQPLPEILAALADGPHHAAEVAVKLSVDFDIGDGANLLARITECLDELLAMGLVSIR
ncbi:MAG: HPr-rel-A system PqqD family peptide chaperone [Sphingopyxis sp.]